MDMTTKEKREHLQDLSEAALRKDVLVPLLTKLGFHDPILYHHSGEKGKDIVCKEFDEKFGKTKYIAVVVKKGNITGSASGANGYFTVLNQVKQALNEPYRHVYELREVLIDQVIIVASGDFLPTALDSVFTTLKAERLDKAIRDVIDVGRLVGLMDKHMGEYWEMVGNETASLVRQRNILLNNTAKLLKILVPDPADRETVLNRLIAEELDIELMGMRDFARYMVDVGYRQVRVEEIDPEFTDPYLNTDHESIKSSVCAIKKRVQKVLMDVDEQIEPLRRILEEQNPKEIIGLCQDVSYHTNSHGQMGVDVSDIRRVPDLEEAVQQYEERRALLSRHRMSELYESMMRDLHQRVRPALLAFWKQHTREDRDWWLGYSALVSLPTQTIVQSATYERQEEPRVLREDSRFPERETSKVIVDTEGSIHVEYAINWYGLFKEEELSEDQKVEQFMWYYEGALAEAFCSSLQPQDALTSESKAPSG